MAPESFPIVHLGFLNFPTLNILWNFLCEVLPRIRVMSTKFYLKSYFITNWRSPRREHHFLPLSSWSSSSEHLRRSELSRPSAASRPMRAAAEHYAAVPWAVVICSQICSLWSPSLFAALGPRRVSGICHRTRYLQPFVTAVQPFYSPEMSWKEEGFRILIHPASNPPLLVTTCVSLDELLSLSGF